MHIPLRRVLLPLTVVCLLMIVAQFAVAKDIAKPNFVVIYCDNLGYGDVGCFGSTKHRTPHIDRMAAEGLKLTSFYSTSGVCTPSRASLMTACYPRRVGLHHTDPDGAVLRPVSPNGLHPEEITIAEVLKSQGYATTCIGKWHLGDQPQFLPTQQGFDSYFGIPYSDDMTARPGKPWPRLPLMQNETVIEAPVDRDLLTRRYTERAIEFITTHRKQPFFLYLPQAMPGSTRRPYASKKFQGQSANGPYGDSVEELDWSTGEILAALKRLGLDEQTLVVWTSDNGAPRRNPPQGSNRPLGGWGYTTMEGGMRVPCVVRWPGRIPTGTTSDELCTTMDLLPTLSKLAGTQPPSDRTIDGKNIAPLLFTPAKGKSPYDAFYYYQGARLQAVRAGRWKQHVADGKPTGLFDLIADIAEKQNIASKHPAIVRRLMVFAERAREDLGDGVQPGRDTRPVGRVEQPTPRELDR